MVPLGFAGVNVGKALIDVFGDFVPRGFRIYHAMSAAEFNMCRYAFPSGRVAVLFVCFGVFGGRNVQIHCDLRCWLGCGHTLISVQTST